MNDIMEENVDELRFELGCKNTRAECQQAEEERLDVVHVCNNGW